MSAAPQFPEEGVPGQANLLSSAVAAVLAPLLAPGPTSPVESPAAWVLLAAARRQFGQNSAANDEADRAEPVDTGEPIEPMAARSMLSIAAVPDIDVSTVPVGGGPSGVAVSGTHAYVSNQADNTVSVVDTTTGAVVATITVGGAPSAVAVTPDGSRVYVANRNTNTVSVINTATNTVVATVKVGTNPDAIAVSPNGTRVYVLNAGTNSITKINTATNKITGTIKVGNSPTAIAFSPDGKKVYVTNKNDDSVSVITFATNGVKTVTAVGDSPTGVTVSPDNTKAYITNLDGTIAVLNTTTNTVTGHITTGTPSYTAALSADGTQLAIANTNDTVTIINTATGTVIQTLSTDPNPETGTPAIAFGTDSKTIYLTDSTDGALRILTVQAVPTVQPPEVGGPPTVGTPDAATGVVTGSLNVTAPDGNALTYTVSNGPTYGVVTVDPTTGTYTYTPDRAARLAATLTPETETDSFTIAVDDGFNPPVTVDVDDVPLAELAASTVLATVEVGSQPAGVAYSPDGTRAYATSVGDGTVAVIDTASNTVIATIHVGNEPVSVAVNPNGGAIYVANQADDTVSVIRTSDNTVIKTIDVGDGPYGIAVSPDGSRVYTTNAGNSVTVIETATNTVTGTIPIDPVGVAFHPTNNRAYVVNQNDDVVSVINTVSGAVIATVNVGDAPVAIAIDPVNDYAYVTNSGDNTVTVIDLTDNTTANVIHVGDNPQGIAVSADGSRIYTANRGSDDISVIDGSSWTVIDSFTVGDEPNGVALSPDGNEALITNAGDGSVTVLFIAGNEKPVRVAAPTVSTPNASGVVTGSLNVVDPDGDPLSYSVTRNPTYGSVVINPATGTYTYTPTPADPAGVTDSFTVSVRDSTNAAVVVTVDNIPVAQVGGDLSIPTGDSPSRIVINTDGTHTYWTNSVEDPVTFERTYYLSDLDTSTNTVTTIALGGPAQWVIPSPTGDRLYVSGNRSVTVFEAGNPTPTVIPVNDETADIAVSPDGAHLYVLGAEAVTVISTTTNTVTGSIPLHGTPAKMRMSPNGAYVYVSVDQFNETTGDYDHILARIDTASAAVTTINIGEISGSAFNGDGSQFYVMTNQGDAGTLTVIDTATNSVSKTTPLPGTADAIALAPDGNHAYFVTYTYDPVTDRTQYLLSTLDTATNTFTSQSIPGYLYDFVFSADSTHTYASGAVYNPAKGDSDWAVTVIDLQNNTFRSIPLNNGPGSLVVTPDGSTVYAIVAEFDPQTGGYSMETVKVLDTTSTL
jgi:YVTN family beta-propeller protein/VCBS repeat-containing protein